MDGNSGDWGAPTTTNGHQCVANTVPGERSGQDWSCCCAGSEAPSMYPDLQRILKSRADLGLNEIMKIYTRLLKLTSCNNTTMWT